MSDIRQFLTEMMKYCGISPFDWLLVECGNVAKVSSIDSAKNMVLKGNFKNVPEELKGDFGIINFKFFTSLLEHPSFKSENSEFFIKKEDDSPVSMILSNHEGTSATFHFTHPYVLPSIPHLKKENCDITFSVSKSKVDEFRSFHNLCSVFSNEFSVSIENEKIFFEIFSPENKTKNKIKMMFADKYEGKIEKMTPVVWPCSIVNFLKLSFSSKDNDVTMGLMKEGAIKITIMNKDFEMNYIILGKVIDS